MTGNIPTTYTRLQTGTKWNQPQSNMGDVVLSPRSRGPRLREYQPSLPFC